VSQRWACLLGHPVAHSLSPALHNAAFAQAGIDAHYAAWDVAPEELPETVTRLRAADCLGANVTAPHKQAVMPLLDSVSVAAQAPGAVNTIVNQAGALSGTNTDAPGLARWMREVAIEAADRPCLVIGAGGAARATVWALAELGASSILVLNRTVERAEALVNGLRAPIGAYSSVDLSWGALSQAVEPATVAWAVIVNATSLGHHGAAPEIDPSCYSRQTVAVELAYNPPETAFMVAARRAGARAENGLGMLVHQAALAFEYWTGTVAPLEAYAAVGRQAQANLKPAVAP
jgi:shikimate dehydrogenase